MERWGLQDTVHPPRQGDWSLKLPAQLPLLPMARHPVKLALASWRASVLSLFLPQSHVWLPTRSEACASWRAALLEIACSHQSTGHWLWAGLSTFFTNLPGSYLYGALHSSRESLTQGPGAGRGCAIYIPLTKFPHLLQGREIGLSWLSRPVEWELSETHSGTQPPLPNPCSMQPGTRMQGCKMGCSVGYSCVY